ATGVPAEKRPERLESPTPDDNRITHGCINVSPEFYERIVYPTFQRGGVFYILPDEMPLAETFPEFAESRSTPRKGGLRALFNRREVAHAPPGAACHGIAACRTRQAPTATPAERRGGSDGRRPAAVPGISRTDPAGRWCGRGPGRC